MVYIPLKLSRCYGHATTYNVHTRCWFNPKLLKVVDTSSETIQVGDFVLVMDSYKKVKGLQDELNIGWKDAMRKVSFFICFQYTNIISNLPYVRYITFANMDFVLK